MSVIDLVQFADAAIGLLAGATSTLLWQVRKGRAVTPVRIAVRKVVGPEAERTAPEVLIATFTGYIPPPGMEENEYRGALAAADLGKLPVNPSTPGMGTTVRAILTYPSLKRVYLISTVSQSGRSSRDSVALLKAWLQTQAGRIQAEVVADAKHTVLLDEDDDVTDATYRVTRSIFSALKEEKLYRPKNSKILVDVTGGTKAMTVGALLACLRPDQDIHLIGARYDLQGRPIMGEAFPLVVSFKPELRAEV